MDARVEVQWNGYAQLNITVPLHLKPLIALNELGKLIANRNNRRAIGGPNFRKRDYFVDTVRNRQGVISAPFKSALSNKPVVVVTEPVTVGTPVTWRPYRDPQNPK
jgi:hypothetical protein